MVKIDIETGIAIPPPARPRTKYPFAAMQVGESFSIRCTAEEHDQVWMRVRAAVTSWKKAHSGHFVVRKLEEDSVLKVRCWRVKPED